MRTGYIGQRRDRVNNGALHACGSGLDSFSPGPYSDVSSGMNHFRIYSRTKFSILPITRILLIYVKPFGPRGLNNVQSLLYSSPFESEFSMNVYDRICTRTPLASRCDRPFLSGPSSEDARHIVIVPCSVPEFRAFWLVRY